jgi:hypothetical protein
MMVFFDRNRGNFKPSPWRRFEPQSWHFHHIKAGNLLRSCACSIIKERRAVIAAATRTRLG